MHAGDGSGTDHLTRTQWTAAGSQVTEQEPERRQRAARQRGHGGESDLFAVDLRFAGQHSWFGKQSTIESWTEHEAAVIAEVGYHDRGAKFIDGGQRTGGELDAEIPLADELRGLIQGPFRLVGGRVDQPGDDELDLHGGKTAGDRGHADCYGAGAPDYTAVQYRPGQIIGTPAS